MEANRASVSALKLSQLALAKFVKVRWGENERGEVSVRERIIGRGCNDREVMTFHSVVSRRFGVTS
jgi:hypothetical protein